MPWEIFNTLVLLISGMQGCVVYGFVHLVCVDILTVSKYWQRVAIPIGFMLLMNTLLMWFSYVATIITTLAFDEVKWMSIRFFVHGVTFVVAGALALYVWIETLMALKNNEPSKGHKEEEAKTDAVVNTKPDNTADEVGTDDATNDKISTTGRVEEAKTNDKTLGRMEAAKTDGSPIKEERIVRCKNINYWIWTTYARIYIIFPLCCLAGVLLVVIGITAVLDNDKLSDWTRDEYEGEYKSTSDAALYVFPVVNALFLVGSATCEYR
eukprot:CAMPEP_0170177006 /NCGR_PEP_ID=MMETSP0040_2-20121228/9741_1 /TAXON_ID=641309 /ORGANISM="Lotharella oceanica, Strain CCMP622" /LENGTH=266 /DNA_ID=CAMNT_0010419499 /DNA_START=348 /DNA_END=1148 /DNA_ORIENTATION=+